MDLIPRPARAVAPFLILVADLPFSPAPEAPRDGRLTDKEIAQRVGDLAAKYGFSPDRARMLLDRFGGGRLGLASAAQDLQLWQRSHAGA